MKRLPLIMLLVCVGCARRPATPNLSVRHCPHDSVPVLSRRYVGQTHSWIWTADSCIAIEPKTKQVMGVFTNDYPYNPYLDVDGDDSLKDEDKKERHAFWARFINWLQS